MENGVDNVRSFMMVEVTSYVCFVFYARDVEQQGLRIEKDFMLNVLHPPPPPNTTFTPPPPTPSNKCLELIATTLNV